MIVLSQRSIKVTVKELSAVICGVVAIVATTLRL